MKTYVTKQRQLCPGVSVVLRSVLTVTLGAFAALLVAVGCGPAAAATTTVADAGTAAPGAAGEGLAFSPMLGLPATNVGLIGEQQNGDVWAQGQAGLVPPGSPTEQSLANEQVLLQYTSTNGDWQIVPLQGPSGTINFNWSASDATPSGGIALIGAEPGQPAANQTLVIGNSGGVFAEAPAPPAADLAANEALIPSGVNPLLAAFDDGSSTDAFVVPQEIPSSGGGTSTTPTTPTTPTNTTPSTPTNTTPSGTGPAGPGVLYYNQSQGNWTREPVCATYNAGTGTCTAPDPSYQPLAIAAASSTSAWLLASVTPNPANAASNPLQLFQRIAEPGGGEVWIAVTPDNFLVNPHASAPVPSGETVTPLTTGPYLTATTQGVWVDGQLTSTAAGATSVSATVLISTDGTPVGTWCYPETGCPAGAHDLVASLLSPYASIAWPGSSGSDPGQRLITNVNGDGSMLSLGNGNFTYEPGAGGGGGGTAVGPGGETLISPTGFGSQASGGAAFMDPRDGWLAGAGGPQVVQVSPSASSSQLTSWPVPFGSPLLAVTTAPGSSPGDPNAGALAVGANGEVAWYRPGEGWQPDYLYNAAGARQTPTLRGVAWPEPGRAYAVGDNGAMWLWQSTTNLWEPDPAEPIGFTADLNAIAFSSPQVGYAVGNQGTLLEYGKTWTQVPSSELPQDAQGANFTSVAFAGSEVIVGFESPLLDSNGTGTGYLTGGVMYHDDTGWHDDSSAEALLDGEQLANGNNSASYRDNAIFKVAGLPDGGAVAAGPGVVIEQNCIGTGPGCGWHFTPQPLPEASSVSALSAFEGPNDQTEALVSIDTGASPDGSLLWLGNNDPPQNPVVTAAGIPTQLPPSPLPTTGYLLSQTPGGGWEDVERNEYPSSGEGQLSITPDPVLALDTSTNLDPSTGGVSGWAIGGNTGVLFAEGGDADAPDEVQTAGVSWLGGGLKPPSTTTAPVTEPSGQATFALGGDASCLGACDDDANIGIGADVWTTTALQNANAIQGLRAFLWTGDRTADDSLLSRDQLDRELQRYDELLGSGGPLQVDPAISPDEVDADADGDFLTYVDPTVTSQTLPNNLKPPAGTSAYAYQSTGTNGGPVDVIVLDYSSNSLVPSAPGSETGTCPSPPPAGTTTTTNQLAWLCAELQYAKTVAHLPAIVLGSANLSDRGASDYASDASAVSQVLVSNGASAYLFDAQGENVSEQVTDGTQSIPAYGSGTLGYVTPPVNPSDNLGAAGYLLVSVNTAQRNPSTNVAPVTAQLIPNIGSLAIDATGGTLLKRSNAYLFSALARVPNAGIYAATSPESNGPQNPQPEPYVPIPETCQGGNCNEFIAPQYSFTSSNPDVGDFVQENPTDPSIVYEPQGKPIQDSASGLFCAYNAGTTTITVSAGGLSYSMPVTVQAGSVEQPCGTAPLSNPPPSGTLTVPNFSSFGTPSNNTPATRPAPTPKATKLVLPKSPVKPQVHQNPQPVKPPPKAVAKSQPKPKPRPKPTQKPSVSAPRTPAAPAAPKPFVSPAPFDFYGVHAAPTSPSGPVARPTPPSGTAPAQVQSPVAQQISQQVGIVEEERKEQAATQIVHHMVGHRLGASTNVAYVSNDTGSLLPLVLALLPLAAAAGVGLRPRRRVELARAEQPVRADAWRRR